MLLLAFLATSSISALAVPQSSLNPPNPPTNLRHSITENRITLDWDAPTNGDPLTAYQVQAGSNPGKNNLANFDTWQNTTRLTVQIGAGLHFIRVRAKNGAGMSAPSNEIQVDVTSLPPSSPNPRFVEPTVRITEDFFGDLLIMGEVQNRVIVLNSSAHQ